MKSKKKSQFLAKSSKLASYNSIILNFKVKKLVKYSI